MGHNFNAQHDDTSSNFHCHWWVFGSCWDEHYHKTIMNWAFEGDDNMDITFSTSSRNVIRPYGDNLPRKSQVWSGSDTSPHGVKLTYWEVRYPRNPVGGSVLEMEWVWQANSGSLPLQLAFVGARNPSGANKDFGYSSYTLTTTPVTNGRTYTLPSGSPGTWQFWPAYKYNNQYGPYQWHMIQIGVS